MTCNVWVGCALQTMSEAWEAFQSYLTTVRANKRLRCPTPGIKLLVLHNLPKRLFWYEIRRTNSTKVDTHTVGINCEFAGKFTVHTVYSVLWATSPRIASSSTGSTQGIPSMRTTRSVVQTYCKATHSPTKKTSEYLRSLASRRQIAVFEICVGALWLNTAGTVKCWVRLWWTEADAQRHTALESRST